MKKKGQTQMIGGLIMLAIIIIVGAIMLQGSAQNISSVVNTRAVANDSLGVASNSTAVYLTDYKSLSSVVVWNQSGVIVPSTNYTVTNNVVYNGALAVKVQPNSSAIWNYTGWTWTISGTAEPLGYADGAGRSISSLIILLMGLALAAVAVGYAVKGYQDKY